VSIHSPSLSAADFDVEKRRGGLGFGEGGGGKWNLRLVKLHAFT